MFELFSVLIWYTPESILWVNTYIVWRQSYRNPDLNDRRPRDEITKYRSGFNLLYVLSSSIYNAYLNLMDLFQSNTQQWDEGYLTGINFSTWKWIRLKSPWATKVLQQLAQILSKISSILCEFYRKVRLNIDFFSSTVFITSSSII